MEHQEKLSKVRKIKHHEKNKLEKKGKTISFETLKKIKQGKKIQRHKKFNLRRKQIRKKAKKESKQIGTSRKIKQGEKN